MSPGEKGAAQVVGVLGAGTMGSGIAQLACRSGARTLLFDPDPAALTRGRDRIAADFDKLVSRGKLEGDAAAAALARIELVETLAELGDCELVIEAAPESLALKRDMIAQLDEIVAEDCVLATNTSSLLVTAVAAGSKHPDRVVGMHYFNPPPVMRLLEVVAGEDSGEPALAVAIATGVAMGKDVIQANDGPGFIVNRCNRPFQLEALRCLSEGVATIEEIDQIVRGSGGFRMGPFELMDLVGVDTGLEVARSFFEQSFGEPRWRPSPIAVRYVAAGRTGRKSGRGYYSYGDGPYRPDDPEPLSVGGGDGVIVIAGEGPPVDELSAAAEAAGWTVVGPDQESDRPPTLVIDCRLARHAQLPNGPRLIRCDSGSLARLDDGAGAVGYFSLPPLGGARVVELTRSAASVGESASAAERFFASLGKRAIWVGDAPGLVLGRIVCQIINESCFALAERVGSASDIDTGLVLGLNHPRGPFAWARAIGLERVLATLDALYDEQHDDCYRAAPLMRSLVAQGLTIE